MKPPAEGCTIPHQQRVTWSEGESLVLRRAGFTLVETLMVVVVMGLVTLIALPTLQNAWAHTSVLSDKGKVTSLYYKTQPEPPWKLAHVRPGVCYIGLVFTLIRVTGNGPDYQRLLAAKYHRRETFFRGTKQQRIAARAILR